MTKGRRKKLVKHKGKKCESLVLVPDSDSSEDMCQHNHTKYYEGLFGSILGLGTMFSCPIGHYSCTRNRFLLVCIEICQFGQIQFVLPAAGAEILEYLSAI